MGRRKGGSGAELVVLVALGLVFAVVSTVYEFIQNNWALIKAIGIVGGILVFMTFVFSRSSRSKQNTEPTPVRPDRLPMVEVPAKRIEAASLGSAAHSLKRERSEARWVGPSETVAVQGVPISGGLFYLGTALPLNGGTTNQYAVNPDLSARSAAPDVKGSTVPYWPSYAEFEPSARRAFLDWMASGRSGPEYDVGYLFLYLYGLEHRVFIEKDLTGAPAIIAEAERLLSVYGSQASFVEYLGRFIDAARAFAGLPYPLPTLSPEKPYLFEIDIGTRIFLGHRLSSSSVLLSEDALIYALALPDVHLRTPGVRCFEEFVALWHLRFRKSFPKGKKVSTRGNITLTYQAASRGFEVEVEGDHQNLPDVAKATTSLTALKRLVEDCTNELDGFSRLLGRRPQARNFAYAALLLPEDFVAEIGFEALRLFDDRLKEMMGGQNQASTKMRNLLALAAFEFAEAGKVAPAVATQLGQLLDRLDVAIEPDRRYGGAIPGLDDQIFLFSAANGGPVDPERPAYRAMKAQVEVAVLAASADGDASSEEMQRVIAGVRDGEGLSGVEKARLIAFAVTIFNSPPKQARVLKLLAERSEAEREAIARAAVAVVGGGDTIEPSEVKFLERLHKTLGMSQERLYSELHRANTPVDEPVAISVERREPGIALPKEAATPAKPAPGVTINAERLARTQRETAAVSDLLASIFEEEAPVPVENPIVKEADHGSLEGLDRAHTDLVEFLELNGTVSKQDFDQLARAKKLLPEGAAERINDWSFDRFDEPLFEEGDEITIATHLRQRLNELRAEAA